MYFSRYCESPYVNTFTAHNNMYVNSLHYILALLDFTINKHIFSVRSPFFGRVSVNVRSVYLLGTLIRYRNVFRYWREFGLFSEGAKCHATKYHGTTYHCSKGGCFYLFWQRPSAAKYTEYIVNTLHTIHLSFRIESSSLLFKYRRFSQL